jgi:predicted TIM-barrel fold metal-dependent hydrolase
MTFELTDTSVFCGHWPFRELPLHSPAELKAHLSARNVRQAWITPLETVLHADPMPANKQLFESIDGDAFFLPTPVINITLATWQRDLELCLNRWKCRIIKLIPNYHRYELADPRVSELLAMCAVKNVPVGVQMRMQDERGHHPLMIVPGVKAESLAILAGNNPCNRFLACGAYSSELKHFHDLNNVWAELSFVESGQALANALHALKPERLVFASHSPLYYFEAQSKKLDVDECDATAEQLTKIAQTNAQELLGT